MRWIICGTVCYQGRLRHAREDNVHVRVETGQGATAVDDDEHVEGDSDHAGVTIVARCGERVSTVSNVTYVCGRRYS